jgi:hypothetical protein
MNVKKFTHHFPEANGQNCTIDAFVGVLLIGIALAGRALSPQGNSEFCKDRTVRRLHWRQSNEVRVSVSTFCCRRIHFFAYKISNVAITATV